MQFFIVSAFLIGLVGLQLADASFLGDRLGLKEGNNNNNNNNNQNIGNNNNGILRKSKGCTVLCSLKINFKKNNRGQPQTCYQLPGKNNVTVSECVYNCLKLKGEKLENATECACQNGVCVAVAPASASSTTTSGISTTETTDTAEETTLPSSSPSSSSSPTPSPTTTNPTSSTTTIIRP